jgi:hypothetical protein
VGILFSAVGGCSEGSVHLTVEVTGGSSTGGVDVGDSSTGGTMMPSGSSGAGPDEPEWPPLEEPCFVRDSCRPQCPPDEQDCDKCRDSSECGEQFPLCDLSVSHCVECINRDDCLNRFGPLFGACSNGRCVQCQVDFDCASDQECDRGWCGSCDRDDDCPDNSGCRFGRCLPY